ncbi:hypothetical protein [Oceanidesulfovibrio marinus]|uniref:hypothetical protein n=1 Tax=Oceanidesulfovibrio marinus TaxID=370038 RepID=UPI00148AE778|nr:hypothetical protein [Oceanidesulfovibrio marinus]
MTRFSASRPLPGNWMCGPLILAAISVCRQGIEKIQNALYDTQQSLRYSIMLSTPS